VNRFSINLATRPFRNNTPYWIGLVTAAVLLSAFTWYNVDGYSGVEGDLERFEVILAEHREAIANLDREVREMSSTVAGMDLVAFSERSAFANEIILSRLFSWTILFDRLEQIMPPKVRVRSIRPTIGKESIEVSIDGMTPNQASLLDFEDALIASEYFNFVYPVHESSRIKEGEINFSVTFGYLPDGARQAPPPEPESAELPADRDPESPESAAASPDAAPTAQAQPGGAGGASAAQVARPPAAGPPEAARPLQATAPTLRGVGTKSGTKSRTKSGTKRGAAAAPPPPGSPAPAVTIDEVDPNDDPNDLDPNDDDDADPNEDDEDGEMRP
jgi:hypothetical protein